MPNSTESATRAEGAADRLRDWLIDGPAQQPDGGVAGVVAADAGCRYVYGEITGYYLHWLAQARGTSTELRRARAERALAWVEANYRDALPPTRIRLDDAQGDWRNSAQFLFDLSMLAGGLALGARAGLIAPLAARMPALANAWDPFVAGGRLRACSWSRPQLAPPPRWSTAGGPFLAKAASRALMANAIFAPASSFVAACRETLQAVRTLGVNSGIGMLHPTLYAMEGVIADPASDAASLRHWLGTLLQLQDAADGSLPETPGVAGVRRSDVAAQALRLGELLGLASHDAASAPALSRLADLLVARVREDGIAFDPDRGARESNVWCAMFAEQALRAHAARLRGEPMPFTPEEIV